VKKKIRKTNKKLLLVKNEIFLRKLKPEKDVTDKYKNWKNDKIIHKYTEVRYKKYSINDIKKYIISKNHSNNEILLGIFLNKNKSIHIGNIKLGPIIWRHKSAEISYFIGNKKLHGKGYASEAIKKILILAKRMGIKKINAGLYKMNKSSKIVLKKNGFKIEGILKSQIIYRKKRYASIIMGKIL